MTENLIWIIKFIDESFGFLGGLGPLELLVYFWPLLLIDFVRYGVLEVIGVAKYLWRARKEREQEARKELYRDEPLISVVIPGKDEGPNLESVVESLQRQTYGNLEIIVVDDGSEDNMLAVGRRLKRNGKIDHFIRQGVRGGKASATNTGLWWAEGEFLVQVDADSVLDSEAIERILLPFYYEKNIGVVEGDVRAGNAEKNLLTRIQALEYRNTITLGRTSNSENGTINVVSGAFGAFRTQDLKRIGGWDMGPGEDEDITIKIRKIGRRVVHAPGAVCYTNVPEAISDLTLQRYRWSWSMVRFRLRKHWNLFQNLRRFRLSDGLALGEGVLMNMVVNVRWYIYMVQIFFVSPSLIPTLFFLNYLFYTGLAASTFGLVKAVEQRAGAKEPIGRGVIALPIFPLYFGIYLRCVRTLGYLMEALHRSSYLTPWTPWKVSKEGIKEGV